MSSLAQRALALLSSSLLLLALGPASLNSSASAAETAPPAFGVQFHGMWSSYDDTQRALFLDQLASSGAEWVRLDVSWAMLQPHGPDSYDEKWGVPFVDRVVRMVTARGLKPLVTLWLTPAWANGGAGERALPDDPNDYARAARWAAERWADQVPAWEVWNEPNSDDFMIGADPVAYTRLLKAAGPAIRAGNPRAKVVFGGPLSNDSAWIEKTYQAGVRGSFDVMATHPYQAVANTPPEAPDDGTRYRFTHLKSVHALMARYGDGDKEIWATEFGWSSHENPPGTPNWQLGVTEAQQGDYLVRALKLVEQEMPYVTHLFWYTDRDRDATHVQNRHYGLFTNDLRPKPAFFAMKDYLLSRSPAAAPAPAPTVAAPAPAGADLAISVAPAPVGRQTGSHAVAVANAGSTASAGSATVTGTVADSSRITSLVTPPTSDWSCVVDARTFLCIGASGLPAGSQAGTITVEVRGATPALTVTVTSSDDPVATNNMAVLA